MFEVERCEGRVLLATFLVTSADDNGDDASPIPNSLRSAIVNSEATSSTASDPNKIDFAIGSGPQTISLLSPLPFITRPVVIDGTTQPGYASNPLVTLDGRSAAGSATNPAFGLVIFAPSSGARGLTISHFAASGVDLAGVGDQIFQCAIENNTNTGIIIAAVGTSVAQSTIDGNSGDGCFVSNVPGNTIGPGDDISRNGSAGVVISGARATGNRVIQDRVIGNLLGGGIFLSNGASNNQIGAPNQGNIVADNNGNAIWLDGEDSSGVFSGSDVSGNRIQGNIVEFNFGDGVLLSDAAGNLIGGRNDLAEGGGLGEGNVVSGNVNDGIAIGSSLSPGPPGSNRATANLIQGNLIGTNEDGTAISDGRGALGNQHSGVLLANDAFGNTIGGTIASEANTVTGNLVNGVEIRRNRADQVGPHDNVVLGNFIGTDPTGQGFLGDDNQRANGQSGVAIVDAPDNWIGMPEPGGGNVIANNSAEGIKITGSNSTGNLVQNNIIGSDISGQTNLGNFKEGIFVSSGSGNVIGGPDPHDRNVISANGGVGITLAFADSNAIVGNYVGTDSTGTRKLGNNQDGILLFTGSSDNVIGGNVISGNDRNGVVINSDTVDNNASGNVLLGNFIGLDATGLARLSNSAAGVFISNSPGFETGSDGTTIPAYPDVPGNLVANNVISGNDDAGVVLFGPGSQGNLVQGNLIGTDASGVKTVDAAGASLGNTRDGVFLDMAGGNTIGGATASEANILAGNGGAGVTLFGVGATGNVVEGNVIGVDRSGKIPMGNTKGGVSIDNAPGNVIGGTSPLPGAAPGNLISGNLGPGVEILGAGSRGNLVQGNLIGTDARAGVPSLANAGDGVFIDNASNNVIGSELPGGRNVISGNIDYGVAIFSDQGLGGNLVLGDFIGIGADGVSATGNALGGVNINGSPNNTIGGLATADRDVISGNGGDGIGLLGPAATGNIIVGDYIGLGADGSLPVGNLLDGVRLNQVGPGNNVSFDVISANLGAGLEVVGTSTAATIQGNVIGLDAATANGLGNSYGVYLNGAVGVTVGGTGPGSGNVISGNSVGVVVTASGAGLSNDAIQGNLIGTDGLGTGVPMGTRQQYGIFLNGSPFNTVGGTTASARNVISGNTTAGILILNQIGSSATSALTAIDPNLNLDNQIQGNLIGTDIAGNPLLAGGVRVQNEGVAINSSAGNVVGGAAGARNTIAGNNIGIEIVGVVSQLQSGQSPALFSGNVVEQDTVDLNGYGVFINGGQYNAITGNDLSLNSSIGLAIVGGAAMVNTVTGNTIDLNGSAASGAVAGATVGAGVFIDGAKGNTIASNEINANGLRGSRGALPTGVGVYVFDNASGNRVVRNRMRNNTAYGILVYNSASNLAAIPRTGPDLNSIDGREIAEFREFTGPVTTPDGGLSPRGPKRRKK
jgi:parallel beta-helix repeat protein